MGQKTDAHRDLAIVDACRSQDRPVEFVHCTSTLRGELMVKVEQSERHRGRGLVNGCRPPAKPQKLHARMLIVAFAAPT